MARDENIFSVTVQKNRGRIGAGLRQAVLHDLAVLQNFLHTDLAELGKAHGIDDFTPTQVDPWQDFACLRDFLLASAQHSPDALADKLIEYYTLHGCGKMAGFAAFRLDEETGLSGVKHVDAIKLEDIVGYEYQKEVLIKNTESFLGNKPANHVLLTGARGTGKSSCVKGLVNRYFHDGLRLVEINKYQLRSLNKVIDALRSCSQKFIIFLDDISFEEAETEYKYLKSVMDGSVERQPDNAVIYATSNRRHLIRETWADREGTPDIHANDTVQEKISLSDRFGITLSFPAPNQEEYLRIVQELAKRHSLALSTDTLKQQALQWELSRPGRSGRAAQQFIRHILGTCPEETGKKLF